MQDAEVLVDLRDSTLRRALLLASGRALLGVATGLWMAARYAEAWGTSLVER